MFHNKIRLVGSSTVDLPHLGLAQPTDNFILKGADGLGPTENDVFLGNTARSGGYYQGRRSQPREGTFLVGLNPDWSTNMTAAQLRAKIYGLLTSPLGAVNLEVMKIQFMSTDTVVAEVEGVLKRVEINPFTDEPQVQIVISCASPYLVDPIDTDITDDSVSDIAVANGVVDDGVAPTGFLFSMIMSSPVTEFTIRDNIDLDAVGLQFITLEDLDLEFGDQLVIDTRPGSRKIYYIPVGFTNQTNLLRKLTDDSTWIFLRPGDNHLYWEDQSYGTSLLISFNKTYWGI